MMIIMIMMLVKMIMIIFSKHVEFKEQSVLTTLTVGADALYDWY